MNVERILGVNIHPLSRKEALEKVWGCIQRGAAVSVFTPGPEFLVRAYRDPGYRAILNAADISLPDGFGLVLFSFGKIQNRVPGADLMMEILKKMEVAKRKAAFLIRKDGLSLSEDLSRSLEKAFPELETKVMSAGKDISEKEGNEIHRTIKDFAPDAIFVGLGAPYQERWIQQEKAGLKTGALFMGVGGALDYISGKVARAPKIFRRLGLEWVWRLAQLPNRFGRIVNATIVFPSLVLKEKFYRKK